MAARLRPEKREEYLALHRDVWPSVADTITECGIRNFTIFVRGDVLIGYFEYIGDDYEADQAKMTADAITRDWWSRTDPCQLPFDEVGAPAPATWQEFDEIWHQD